MDERIVCLVIVFELDLEKFALVLDLSMVLISTKWFLSNNPVVVIPLLLAIVLPLKPTPADILKSFWLDVYLSLRLSKLRLFPTFKFSVPSALKFAPLMVVSLAVFMFISLLDIRFELLLVMLSL